MRAPLSWIREYVDLPADVDPVELAHRLTALGLKLEALEAPGADIEGPLVVGGPTTVHLLVGVDDLPAVLAAVAGDGTIALVPVGAAG